MNRPNGKDDTLFFDCRLTLDELDLLASYRKADGTRKSYIRSVAAALCEQHAPVLTVLEGAGTAQEGAARPEGRLRVVGAEVHCGSAASDLGD